MHLRPLAASDRPRTPLDARVGSLAWPAADIDKSMYTPISGLDAASSTVRASLAGWARVDRGGGAR